MDKNNLENKPTNLISKLVHEAILTIESEYMYILGVEDLAEHLGVTKNHLIREFSKYLNTTPNKYLTLHRLNCSKGLLITGLSIEDVAHAVGFSTGNYFAKVFKKEFNQTPTQFIKSAPVIHKPFTDPKIYL